jgi:DNA-binding transcriptional LysR family regulator
MNDKQLESLIYVARHGTFKQAAEALYFDSSGEEFITPESMQYRIKQLEHELGVSLYRKRQGSSRVLLTREGQLFLREAIEVHQRMNEWRELFLDAHGGTITFATTQAVLIHRISGVVKTFIERHPRVRLRMVASSAPEIEEMVEQGRVDFGLSTRPPEQSELEYLLWKRSRMICVVPEAHPLAARSQVTLQEIANFPLLLLEPEIRGDRELVEDAFRQLGIRNTNVILEAGNSEILLSFVEAGLGITVIAETAMLQQRRRLKTIEIADPLGKTEVGLLVREGQYMPQRVQQFLRLVDPMFGKWLDERQPAPPQAPGPESEPVASTNGKARKSLKIARKR